MSNLFAEGSGNCLECDDVVDDQCFRDEESGRSWHIGCLSCTRCHEHAAFRGLRDRVVSLCYQLVGSLGIVAEPTVSKRYRNVDT
jgi:hypothetical protein